MAKGISISVASDTRDFMRGVKTGVLEPLEDVTDALKDVERESDTAGSALEDSMRDGQRKTEDAADEVKDLKDALRDAERSAKDMGRAGKDAGDDTRDGMRRAEDGVEEFRDEAASTATEAAASFDGSAESIGSAFQEVAANAFAGFGPAGAVAGIAAAAGIGLAIAGFEAANEAEQLSRERAAEWAAAYIEAGNSVLTAATQAQLAQDIITDSDRWQEAKDNAEEWGVSTATAVAAMTGETWALEAAQASLTERQEEAVDTSQAYTDAYGNVSLVQAGANQELVDGQAALDALNAEMDAGRLGADTYSETLVLMAQNTAGATQSVDEFGDSIYSLPDGTQVYVDAETGQATMDVDAIENRIYAVDGSTATVYANASTGSAEYALNTLVRSREAKIRVQVQTRLGAAIEV